MTKALAFAKLDLITIKPYFTWKNLVILVGVALVMSWNSTSTPATIGFIMMFGSLYVSYPFSVGEKNGIDALYATLSITRAAVVLGRYFFALAFNLCTAALAFIVTCTLSITLKKNWDPKETLLVTLAILVAYSAIQAFQLPIYFKLGYSRAKLIAYLPLIGWPLVVTGLSFGLERVGIIGNFSNIILWIEQNTILFVISCAALWIVIMYFSYRISLSYYQKRDF